MPNQCFTIMLSGSGSDRICANLSNNQTHILVEKDYSLNSQVSYIK